MYSHPWNSTGLEWGPKARVPALLPWPPKPTSPQHLLFIFESKIPSGPKDDEFETNRLVLKISLASVGGASAGQVSTRCQEDSCFVLMVTCPLSWLLNEPLSLCSLLVLAPIASGSNPDPRTSQQKRLFEDKKLEYWRRDKVEHYPSTHFLKAEFNNHICPSEFVTELTHSQVSVSVCD